MTLKKTTLSTVFMEGIDAKLLKKQRQTLDQVIQSGELTEYRCAHLEGILNLLDAIADIISEQEAII